MRKYIKAVQIWIAYFYVLEKVNHDLIFNSRLNIRKQGINMTPFNP